MAEADESKPPRDGKLRWVLGWIVLPGSLIAALFLAGVHVGARHPDMGLARLVLKVFGSKAGVAEPHAASHDEPRPGAKPGEPFEYSDSLRAAQLEAIADKSLGLSVDELSCEDVCRAYSKARYDAPVYSVEHCELGRALSSAPRMLICRGKLEAVEAPAESERADDPNAPADAQRKPAE